MVSVLIPTFNEENNIAFCINSVSWADEVVVVDSASQDATRETAKAIGATVVEFKWNGKYPKKKNWALENIRWRNEWVLILDADEQITPGLAAEIKDVLRQPACDGYYINRRFMFLGKWIRHCGYYPSWNLRLFKHRLGRYEKIDVGDIGSGDNEVHEHVVLKGKAGYLQNDMLHYAYPDIHTWIEKHNRYSSWEAAIEVGGANLSEKGIGKSQERRRKLRLWSRKLPFRPTLRFIYSYFIQGGILDGAAGWRFCRLLAMYERMIVFKIKEKRDSNKAVNQ
ncbi:glycosyltransferase family 2 protein [Fontisphaera persica]|uniref:glycosyltransferase family 2 protein n=1 Tax=Fontisphaera persica TaxID=2974023 RepID=UPI0024BF434C|nr:glycosyltransferase family 2 protein [Fontisphaera persica]WCJ59713.1 glycosyltransferase family 2 protein [Fontisphaera persica]